MSGSFENLGFTASRLLAKFGTAMMHISVGAPEYTPGSNKRAITPEPVLTRVKGLIVDGPTTRDERGTALAPIGQRRIYLAGADITPKVGDRVTVGTTTFTIDDVLPVYAGDVIALYDIRAARA